MNSTVKDRTALEELARLTGRSTKDMEREFSLDAPARGVFAEIPGDDGYRCANFGTSVAGIGFDASLCAKLVDGGVSYKVEFKIEGHTVISEGGTLTATNEQTQFHADFKVVSGTLTIGVNQWSSHYCPFIKWNGKVSFVIGHKDIDFDHQFFCLR